MRSAAPAALIFDVDGVIVDSTASHTEAWRRYLAEHGIALDRIADRMLGKHNDDIVREFFAGQPMSAADIRNHGTRKERLYRELVAPSLKRLLVPGLTRFIEERCGTPMAVASNAEPANVEFILEAAGIAHCFRAVVDGDDVERPKPAPDVYLEAARRLGVPPAGCAVFEDSLTGVEAAKAAGMKVIALTTTIADFDGVDLVIRDFDDPQLHRWLAEVSS